MINKLQAYWRKFLTQSQATGFDLDAFEPLLPQPDKELTLLLERLQVDEDTLETHLALAQLFRSRGETDRAIRIHETLLQSDQVLDHQKRIRVEMAHDYFAAGLLGHAEKTLQPLMNNRSEAPLEAFRLWLTLLERQGEWQAAIEVVRRYAHQGSGQLRLANLYCEYALQLQSQGDENQARLALKEARKTSSSARSFILSAEFDWAAGRFHRALRLLKEGIHRDIRRLDVILPILQKLAYSTGGEAMLRDYLEALYQRHPSHRILAALLDLVGQADPNVDQWQHELEQVVSAGASFELMQRWLQQRQDIGQEAKSILMESLKRLKLRIIDRYQCTHCGFESHRLLWLCPQCECWETAYSKHEHDLFTSTLASTSTTSLNT